MIRILEVTESLASGGRENFAINILRNVDQSKMSFDFFSLTSKPQFYTEEVLQYGCKILSSDTEKVDTGFYSFLKKNIFLAKTVKSELYDVVHIHADTHLDYFKVIMIRLYSKSKIVLHDHGAMELRGFKKIFGRVCRHFGRNIPSYNIACSEKAANYFFDKSTSYRIINNPIDVEKFRFSDKYRSDIREQYHLDSDAFVVGHIGRYSIEKNHIFIIDTFFRLNKVVKNSMLVLVGEGDLKQEIIDRVREYNLDDKVIFIDVMNDVYRIYSAIDCFWFPSLTESFGNTAVEAQISGTPVITSEGVSQEVLINENTDRLEYNPEMWVNKTIELKRITEFNYSAFSKFSSGKIVNEIEKIYRGCLDAK